MKAQISVHVDVDRARGLVTRRSVAGIVIFINQTAIQWISKHQFTVEASTYGNDTIDPRIAAILIIEHRYALRMVGFDTDGPTCMFGDNMSFILSTTMPSSSLKNKQFRLQITD
jgi:hypothetical protein